MERASEVPRLAATQRRLRRLITAPDGVEAALAAEAVDGWLASDAILPAARRLEVYGKAYFQRIHDCLGEDFGSLAAAIGEDAFHDLVTAYLLAHPPHRPSLRFAGLRVAEFLGADPVAEPFRRRWPWAADLARLEWALVDAFDAADSRPLGRHELSRIPPPRWPLLRLRFHAAVRILGLGWPVLALRQAWERGEDPKVCDAPQAQLVCVWRRGERVCFRELEPLEGEVLERALRGQSVGELCEFAERALGEPAAPVWIAEQLGGWVRDEWIAVATCVGAAPAGG